MKITYFFSVTTLYLFSPTRNKRKNQTLVTHKNIVNFILCDVPAAYFLVIANKF